VNAKPATHFTYSASGTTVDFALDPGIDAQAFSWNFGDGSPLNTTDLNPSHTYPASYPYWVVVSVTNSAGCDSTYTEQLDLPTGISNSVATGIRLFPNPATDKIFIQRNSLTAVSEIMIMDIDGRVERSIPSLNHSDGISVTDLIPGIYFLKLTEENGISTLYKFEVYR
jgi:hypothetical protein